MKLPPFWHKDATAWFNLADSIFDGLRMAGSVARYQQAGTRAAAADTRPVQTPAVEPWQQAVELHADADLQTAAAAERAAGR